VGVLDRKIIDWRFLAMLVVMLLVATACWGFVARQNQVDRLIDISQRSTKQVEVLTAKVDAQNAQADAQSRVAAQQRAALRKQNRDLTTQLQALVDYLTAHGIAVPTLTPASSSSGGGANPKDVPAGPPPHPKHPESPGPTATPAPTTRGIDLGLLCELLPILCTVI